LFTASNSTTSTTGASASIAGAPVVVVVVVVLIAWALGCFLSDVETEEEAETEDEEKEAETEELLDMVLSAGKEEARPLRKISAIKLQQHDLLSAILEDCRLISYIKENEEEWLL